MENNIISKSTHPKVLLLGNGILRAHGGESWNAFLASIATLNKYKTENAIKRLNCPAPLKAILVTGDQVNAQMKEKFKDEYNFCISQDLYEKLYKLVSLDFTHILTTNYTYELENLSTFPNPISYKNVRKLMKHTDNAPRAETKYLLHTYNEIEINSQSKKIWHIHGEMRKPDSTIIGHYYYGSLLFKIKEYLNKNGTKYSSESRINSWIDAFILGDIYCIGLGFDFADFDLWWLLNRKARENASVGSVYFYEPAPFEFDAKQELLKTIKTANNGKSLVSIINCGYDIDPNDSSKLNKGTYADFYNDVINDLITKV